MVELFLDGFVAGVGDFFCSFNCFLHRINVINRFLLRLWRINFGFEHNGSVPPQKGHAKKGDANSKISLHRKPGFFHSRALYDRHCRQKQIRNRRAGSQTGNRPPIVEACRRIGVWEKQDQTHDPDDARARGQCQKEIRSIVLREFRNVRQGKDETNGQSKEQQNSNCVLGGKDRLAISNVCLNFPEKGNHIRESNAQTYTGSQTPIPAPTQNDWELGKNGIHQGPGTGSQEEKGNDPNQNWAANLV
mmetsp:Transcript_6678/g.16286  ORF Transcript_6678/g.16286 Transcript_6678/m.16286 type:complete len:247 (-) Transcript_6678:19-759(-)